jgi:uncharacterized protein YcfJ
MNPAKILFTVAIPALLVSVPVNAYKSQGRIFEASVVSAEPVYETVQVNNPTEECWQETVSVPVKTSNSHTPQILGAIVGAGVGRLFGSGRGQDVATVAGAILGGSVGRDYNSRNQAQNSAVRYEQRCRVVDRYHSEERFQGYKVTYEYNNILYTTHMHTNPGETITVSVDVVPVET